MKKLQLLAFVSAFLLAAPASAKYVPKQFMVQALTFSNVDNQFRTVYEVEAKHWQAVSLFYSIEPDIRIINGENQDTIRTALRFGGGFHVWPFSPKRPKGFYFGLGGWQNMFWQRVSWPDPNASGGTSENVSSGSDADGGADIGYRMEFKALGVRWAWGPRYYLLFTDRPAVVGNVLGVFALQMGVGW